MQVMVSIMLAENDTMTMTPDEIAASVLQGLNGDPTKDTVSSTVQKMPESGFAGNLAPPPEPPPETP